MSETNEGPSHSLYFYDVGVLLLFVVLAYCYCLLQNGVTALLLAAENDNFEVAKVLLESGANTEVLNKVNIHHEEAQLNMIKSELLRL